MKRLIGLLVTVYALALLGGCVEGPPGEVRTYLEDPQTAGMTDASRRWNMTSMRQSYVCPYCGWSVDRAWDGWNPVECNNYHNVPGHPPAVIPARVPLKQRLLDIIDLGAGAANTCDISYTDAAGVDHNLALMGRSYHAASRTFIPIADNPTADEWNESRVFTDAHGLTHYRDTDNANRGDQLPGIPTANDRARFLYVPPGVQRPQAYAYHDITQAGPMTIPADIEIGYGDGVGRPMNPTLLTTFFAQVNPYRVSWDDRYWARYSIREQGVNTMWRFELYSRMNGLEFDSGMRINYPASDPFFLVSYSGALRVRLPALIDEIPNNGAPTVWVFTFRIASNCRIVPGGFDGADLDNAVAARAFDPTPLAGFATMQWPSWPTDGPYLRIIDTDGNGTADLGHAYDTQDVYRSGASTGNRTVFPFIVPPGVSGVGRAVAQWSLFSAAGPVDIDTPADGDHLSGDGSATNAYRNDDPQDPAAGWYEWWYDRNWSGSNYVTARNGAAPRQTLTNLMNNEGWAAGDRLDTGLWTPPQEIDTIEARFTVTRLDVEPTNENDAGGPMEPAFVSTGSAAYPRISADGIQGGARTLAVAPGATTERRFFQVAHHAPNPSGLVRVASALAEAGGAFSDETSEANDAAADDLTLWPAAPVAGDAYYFGGDSEFCGLILNATTTAAMPAMNVVWEYSRGTGTWSTLNTWQDSTAGLLPMSTGRLLVRFDPPTNWGAGDVNGVTGLYWIRARCTSFTGLVTPPEAGQAWLMPTYYNMTRCPSCHTTFIDQPGGTSPAFPHHEAGPPAAAGLWADNLCPYCYYLRGNSVPVEAFNIETKPDVNLVESLKVPQTDAGNPWLASHPTKRPTLPDEAVKLGPLGRPLPRSGPKPGSSLAMVPFWVKIDVPRYQPASQRGPGANDTADMPGNDPANNYPYRGQAALFQSDRDRWYETAPDNYGDNGRWDIFYSCPDCGTATPRWEINHNYVVGDTVMTDDDRAFVCTAAHTSDGSREPAVRAWGGSWTEIFPEQMMPCANASCPGHVFCQSCGLTSEAGTVGCPYCGGPVTSVPRTQNMNHVYLAAEEFDLFDLQVSVLKLTQLVAQATSTAVGRVAPGVDPINPDQTTTAAGGTPALPWGGQRRATPAAASDFGQLAIRNDGNTIPDMSGVVDPFYALFRPEAYLGEANNQGRAISWAGIRNSLGLNLLPGARLTHDFRPDTLTPMPGVWQPMYPPTDAVAGTTATVDVRVAGVGDRVPTGQQVGRYSGLQLYYMDLDGDGEFDFQQGGADVTNATALFDPERDEAYEPFTAADVHLRVAESRFPFNDYLATDEAPVPRFEYDANGEPIGLQVIWQSNRTTATVVGNAAGPGGVPAPNAPTNLVYASAPAITDGNGQRNYLWDTSVSPLALTASTGAYAQNGPAAVYANGLGAASMNFAVWHATNRVSGGLAATIRTDSAATGAGWTGSGPGEYLWSGNERAEGVRGFFSPYSTVGGVDSNWFQFRNAAAGDIGHWAMWHSGRRGQERIMFRATVTDTTRPAGQQTVAVGGYLPVDNSIAAGDPDTTVVTLHDADGVGPEIAVPVTLQRHPHGPFTAVKDVSPMLYLPPVLYDTSGGGGDTQPQVRVFFAGYGRHTQNFDIYEVRFNWWDLLGGGNNHGKLEMASIGASAHNYDTPPVPSGPGAINPTAVANGDFGSGPGELFESNAMRQEFNSRHIDWSTSTGFLSGGGTGDASIRLGIRRHSVDNLHEYQYYNVVWSGSPHRGERYDQQRGVFNVIPRFEADPLFDQMMPPAYPTACPVGGVGRVLDLELVEPDTRLLPVNERRPVRLEIDPTLGRVRFSAPLFNTQNPADQSCVFNTVDIPDLVDVVVCGTYHPFILRHTTSPADDDSVTAIMESGPWEGNAEAPPVQARPWPLHGTSPNLNLFWRRSFASGQAPFYGRTCYMMKRWSFGARVNHPPMAGAKTDPIVRIPHGEPVPGLPGGQLRGPGMPQEVPGALPAYPNVQVRDEYDVDMTNGEVAVWPGVYRWVTSPNGSQHRRSYIGAGSRVQVEYTDAGGVLRQESHLIGGWSQETTIPIDTVFSEGPLRVAEEVYSVPTTTGTVGSDPSWPVARRYWLFWTSTRPTYDIRSAGVGGSFVRQSSDVYYCSFAPEFPTLTRDLPVNRCDLDSFRPPF